MIVVCSWIYEKYLSAYNPPFIRYVYLVVTDGAGHEMRATLPPEIR